MGLLQCLLLSIRRAFEGALRHSDLPSPAALVRLHQLLSLHPVQLEYSFAFLALAQPRLLRRRELSLFQRFEITVFNDALCFAAIDDGFSFPRIARLAFEERHGPANKAFAVCAKGFQRFFLPLIDALNLAAVYRDGRVLVFPEAVHLIAVQSSDVVRLPTMLLLLLRFLTLLAFGDCGFRAPPDIRGERMSLVLLSVGSLGFIPVVRLAAELPSRTLLFDGGLTILCAPVRFFADRFLPALRAFPFLLPTTFGGPPFLRFR